MTTKNIRSLNKTPHQAAYDLVLALISAGEISSTGKTKDEFFDEITKIENEYAEFFKKRFDEEEKKYNFFPDDTELLSF